MVEVLDSITRPAPCVPRITSQPSSKYMRDVMKEIQLEIDGADVHGASHVDVHVSGFKDMEWEEVLDMKVIANAFVLKTGLTRKIPQTTILCFEDGSSSDDESPEGLVQRQCNSMGCFEDESAWIIKACDANRGEDISVVSNSSDLMSFLQSCNRWQRRDWVLQKYISNPLLWSGRKFHMRVHVLCVGTMKVFVHDNVVCIAATVQYQDGDYSNKYVHTTNHCIQKGHFKYNDGRNALLRQVCDQLKSEGAAEGVYDRIFEQIKDIAITTFRAGSSTPAYFLPLDNCFELFGLDVMVDADLNCFLLEVNSDPSMSIFEESMKEQCVKMWKDTLQLIVPAHCQPTPQPVSCNVYPEKKLDGTGYHYVGECMCKYKGESAVKALKRLMKNFAPSSSLNTDCYIGGISKKDVVRAAIKKENEDRGRASAQEDSSTNTNAAAGNTSVSFVQTASRLANLQITSHNDVKWDLVLNEASECGQNHNNSTNSNGSAPANTSSVTDEGRVNDESEGLTLNPKPSPVQRWNVVANHMYIRTAIVSLQTLYRLVGKGEDDETPLPDNVALPRVPLNFSTSQPYVVKRIVARHDSASWDLTTPSGQSLKLDAETDTESILDNAQQGMWTLRQLMNDRKFNLGHQVSAVFVDLYVLLVGHYGVYVHKKTTAFADSPVSGEPVPSQVLDPDSSTAAMVETLRNDMEKQVRGVLKLVSSHRQDYLSLANCFQLVRFRFGIDTTSQPYILEISSLLDNEPAEERIDQDSLISDLIQVALKKFFPSGNPAIDQPSCVRSLV